MQVLFITASQNAKTGPIPASIIERASCWPGCALYENSCYAEAGALGVHWDRVSRGLAGGSWSEFCAKVAALRPGRPAAAARVRATSQGRRGAPRTVGCGDPDRLRTEDQRRRPRQASPWRAASPAILPG